jgi:Pvc16 N-terminal domain
MSNAFSIAAVTAVLKDLLENGLVKDAIATSVGDVVVTALPPDRITQGTDERAQINLFLYQVTQNRNADWVSSEYRSKRSQQSGDSRHNQPLALDLHYLLTAYGAKDFQAELLLGYAMQLLHDTPVFSRELVESSLKNAAKVNTSSVLSQALTSVSIADVAENIGQIKLSPEFFNMEDTSKLWSSLQTNYRPSAAYQVSMVLIDSRNAQKLVDTDKCPFLTPVIEQVTPPSEVGKALIIRGKHLRGEMTHLRLQGLEKLIEPKAIQDKQISAFLPPGLFAGVYGVQVVHLKIPVPGISHHDTTSNIAAFVLHPTITATVAQIQGSGDNLRAAEITVQFNPKVGKQQQVVLLMNEVSNNDSEEYSFAVASRVDDNDSITIPIKNIKAGTYFIRVQVDGAESPLNKNSAGEYESPQVKIP